MKRPDHTKKRHSDKIEVNRYKIYRVTDYIQFASLFFSSRNAAQKRAAFLAIYFEIKNAPNQKIHSLDHIAVQYSIHPSAVAKVRAKMVRLGLIVKQVYGWQFASVFKNSLEELIRLADKFKAPAENINQLKTEKIWVEMAKGETRKVNPKAPL
jgi:hypothetical protein